MSEVAPGSTPRPIRCSSSCRKPSTSATGRPGRCRDSPGGGH
jgi:hypothetical protein